MLCKRFANELLTYANLMHQMWCEQDLKKCDLSFEYIAEQFLMFSENLHSWQEFYTITGRTGRAKYQLCLVVINLN